MLGDRAPLVKSMQAEEYIVYMYSRVTCIIVKYIGDLECNGSKRNWLYPQTSETEVNAPVRFKWHWARVWENIENDEREE